MFRCRIPRTVCFPAAVGFDNVALLVITCRHVSSVSTCVMCDLSANTFGFAQHYCEYALSLFGFHMSVLLHIVIAPVMTCSI